MSTVAIIQARMGSSRLPNKTMADLLGKPMLWHLINRIRHSKKIDKIVIATTTDEKDKVITRFARKNGIDFFAGSENDVLERYYYAAKKYKATVVVRITADCPLIDPDITDKAIEKFRKGGYDYLGVDINTYPNGFDSEVFTFKTLEKAFFEAKLASEREHVTPYIWKNPKIFKIGKLSTNKGYGNIRLTVDHKEDLDLVTIIYKALYRKDGIFHLDEIADYLKKNKDLVMINKGHDKFEGYKKSLKADATIGKGLTIGRSQLLYKKAKTIIPGGTMLLSKRPEMFLPDYWPAYYQKAKGITVWDLDGKKYTDMTIMGIGTNVLGYANEEVNKAVINAVKNGSASTLNCPEEVRLAEKLIELHPWAEMVRFARTGGESCAIAVRIGRAASGKDGVAFCGYHGWSDWYLAANLANDKNLDGQLLPGLEPKGVPRGLKGSAIPFEYNRLDQLEKIIQTNDIGVIIMEPVRDKGPKDDFLKKVRTLATKHNIVLIFDEVTSGFRKVLGGIHLHYGIDPDIAILGKALGNGYPIGAVIGKRSVMDAAQSTFISSTFWTERIGPAAALATLHIMERDNVPAGIDKMGGYIGSCWEKLAEKHGLALHVGGLPSLTHFDFDRDHLKIKTIITQEMLKKGYLAGNSVYVCTLHSKKIVDKYMDDLEDVFKKVKHAMDNNMLDKLLIGQVCMTGFKRLN